MCKWKNSSLSVCREKEKLWLKRLSSLRWLKTIRKIFSQGVSWRCSILPKISLNTYEPFTNPNNMQFIVGGNCSKLNTITRKKTHAQQVWTIPCHVGKKIKKSMEKIPSFRVCFVQVIQLLKKKSYPTWKEHPTHKGCLFLFFLGHPIWNIICVNLIRFPPQISLVWKKNKSAKLWRLVHFGSRRHRIPWNWIPWSATILIHQDTVLLNQLELPAIEYKLGLAPSHCDALRKMGGGGFLPDFCHLHHQEDKIWPL